MIRVLLPATVLLASLTGFSMQEEPVSVATWNLRNFSVADRYEAGSYRIAYPMPEDRKRSIRRLILKARPSILFLQEVGSPAFLKELQLDLASDGLDYPFSAFSGEPGNRSGLALLSRFPLQEIIFHHPVLNNTGLPLRRGIQEIVLRVRQVRFHFFHVHLKSRYSTDPQDPEAAAARSAELQALDTFLQRQVLLRPAASLVLLGDFNTPFSDPLIRRLDRSWQALPAIDQAGRQWTYFHRQSGARDRLDGFWSPRDSPVPLHPARILPLDNCPSDHRLLLAALFFPEKPCPSPLNDN